MSGCHVAPPKCKSLMATRFAKLISDNESQETWIQALKNHKSKGDINKSTLEEAQKLVPREYWDYLDGFQSQKVNTCHLESLGIMA